jgi:hypothetical protein
MSNHLAIATVTATLQRTLQERIQSDLYGARVTTLRPINLGSGPSESGVNIFLYQVNTNPALHNMDATPFRVKGNPSRRTAALDLYYLFSFYGNETDLEPQRLLGSAIRTMNDRRILTAEMVKETLADSTFSFLQDSNLADQIQQINVLPMDMSLDDLSKTWSAFFQTPYILSIVYKVMVVLIESEEPWKRALPVRGRNLGGVTPFPDRPSVEQIINQEGRFNPIFAHNKLIIRGRNLESDRTQIRLGENLYVNPDQVTENEIILSLGDIPTESLTAGVQSLQVIHQVSTGLRPTPSNKLNEGKAPLYRNVESNVTPFVLCPTIMDLTVDSINRNRDETRSAEITIVLNLTIGKKQAVVLAMNEWSMEEYPTPVSYLFDAPPREEDSNSITIAIAKVKATDYLLRLTIDGAESQLEFDEDENSETFGWYIAPKVTIN